MQHTLALGEKAWVPVTVIIVLFGIWEDFQCEHYLNLLNGISSASKQQHFQKQSDFFL